MELRRTVVSNAIAKFSQGQVGPREIAVIASDATVDRMGDIIEPHGVQLDNYRRNPIVLAQHDADSPVGRCISIGVEGGAVRAKIQFAPEGVSELADEYCRLAKTGIISAVSVGFAPLKSEPIRDEKGRSTGGLRFTSWELLELSLVSVPANPAAVVIARSAPTDELLEAAAAGRRMRHRRQ